MERLNIVVEENVGYFFSKLYQKKGKKFEFVGMSCRTCGKKINYSIIKLNRHINCCIAKNPNKYEIEEQSNEDKQVTRNIV